MPVVAKNRDTGELVIIEDADPLANFVCPDCDQTVAYVREHHREGVDDTVSAFFRYDNCPHLGSKTSESEHDHSGGGGNAEDPIHRRRKWTALQVALNRFDHSQYSTEKYIGSKRADAVLEFDEPHEEYGRGLVIEYQHKNESKDIVKTERHFAEYEYTTLWLWEDQFKSLDGIPEVDLFGGRVFTPWPYAVPEQSDWSDLDHYIYPESKYRTQAAIENRSTTLRVEATTPHDWYWPTTAEYWWTHGWHAAFRSPNGEYPEREHRAQAAIPRRPSTLTVEATVPHDWYWPTTAEYWLDQGWDAAFRQEQTEHPLDAYRDNATVSIGCTLPPTVVDTLVYERLEMSSLPQLPPANTDRGDATAIPATLTPELAEALPEPGKYSCRDCIWVGDDYQVQDDGSTAGTAVCPECSSGIRLNI